MVYFKKVLVLLCVVMIVMNLIVVSSYSQEKPSENIIVNIIIKSNIYYMNHLTEEQFNKYYGTFKVNEFQITHSFFKKGSDGRDNYCIEVNYDISYTIFYLDLRKTMNGKVEKYHFTKVWDEWWGYKGWNIE